MSLKIGNTLYMFSDGYQVTVWSDNSISFRTLEGATIAKYAPTDTDYPQALAAYEFLSKGAHKFDDATETASLRADLANLQAESAVKDGTIASLRVRVGELQGAVGNAYLKIDQARDALFDSGIGLPVVDSLAKNAMVYLETVMKDDTTD